MRQRRRRKRARIRAVNHQFNIDVVVRQRSALPFRHALVHIVAGLGRRPLISLQIHVVPGCNKRYDA